LLREIDLNLKEKYIILVNPGIHIGTKEAYAGVQPGSATKSIESILSHPIDTWQNELVNQFEESIFPKYPSIKQIKHSLIELGAVYASMSGSGSSLFGIFNEKPSEDYPEFKKHVVFEGLLSY
jgi:4-diphosphocytidyl-2-C-methyl-D-erythritol kinase